MHRTHEATLVPFGSGTKQDVVVLVTNSNVKHQLSGSEYPTRVRQCQEAVTALKKMFPSVKALRDVTLDMLSKVQYSMNTEAYQRAKHCVTEDIRTLGTVEALKVGDFAKVGNYMSESHDSLSKDFEVSCDELDILKELALKVPGVYGSRMTGGGFGGCTVTLVEKSAVPQLKEFLKKEYFTRTQIECEFYDAEPSAGAGPIDLEPYLGWSFFFDAESKAALQGVVNWAVPLAAVGLIVGIAINASRNKR